MSKKSKFLEYLQSESIEFKSSKTLNVFQNEFKKSAEKFKLYEQEEVKAREIQYDEFSNHLIKDNSPVFAYLKSSKTPEKVRVHFSYCGALKIHPASRFFCTNKNDGLFFVDSEAKDINGSKEYKLSACKWCISEYFNISKEDRDLIDQIANKFDFKGFSKTERKLLNKAVWKNKMISIVGTSWEELTETARKTSNWTCQKCDLHLGEKNRAYLHTHHIDRDRGFNHPINFKVLCIRCHSDEPGHGHTKLKKSVLFSEFMKKIGKGEIKVSVASQLTSSIPND